VDDLRGAHRPVTVHPPPAAGAANGRVTLREASEQGPSARGSGASRAHLPSSDPVDRRLVQPPNRWRLRGGRAPTRRAHAG
jgi:hypothetical protein